MVLPAFVMADDIDILCLYLAFYGHIDQCDQFP